MFFLVWFLFCFWCVCGNEQISPQNLLISDDSYSETLLLRTIPSKQKTESHLLAHFHFSVSTFFPSNEETKTAYDLFPAALGGILQQYYVEEFHLSFTSGRWEKEFGPLILPAPHGGYFLEFYSFFFFFFFFSFFSFLSSSHSFLSNFSGIMGSLFHPNYKQL
jgi:hypothetical protein